MAIFLQGKKRARERANAGEKRVLDALARHLAVGLDELDTGLSRVEELRLLYVGMARATHRLFLSAMGTSRIVDHVEQALHRVKKAYG